ncbi:ABC transporter ATP-binding protein [Gemmatimonadota bacterium]
MRIFRRVLSYLRPYRAPVAGSIICTIFFTVFSGLMVWMLMPTLETLFNTDTISSITAVTPTTTESGEQILPGEDEPQALLTGLERIKISMKDATRGLINRPDPTDTLIRLCLVYLLVVVLKNIFAYLQGYLMAVAENGLIKDLRVDLFNQMSRLSLGFFEQNRTGVLLSRVTSDVSMVNRSAAAVLVEFVKHPLSVLIFLAMAVVINLQLTLISLLILPISAWIITRIGRSLFRRTGRLQTEMGNITAILNETLSGIRVVKAFDMEEFETNRFAVVAGAYYRKALNLARVGKLAAPSSEVAATIVGIGILYIGGVSILGGTSSLTPDEFITFLLVIFSMFTPIREIGKAYGKLQQGLAAAERVFNIIDTPPVIIDEPDAVSITEFSDVVEFRNLSFEYVPGNRVLSGIDLSLRKGEIVALVGPSGAGKSTLADMLPRFYDPVEGSVEIDGVDIRQYSVSSIRRLIGVVTQDTILFNESVTRNIAYGLEEYAIEKVKEAARAANAHDFVEYLPDGYETFVGDRGVRLSGGQRQRLAIARAIMKNPPILILDEATSSLDTESEMLVQEAIEHLMRERTTLVIAHRLSTVQKADLIVVLDAGRIIQLGTHEELMTEEEGLYRRLYTLQFQT